MNKPMTVVGASLEYWRLQEALEALTQEQYEGAVGERLMARQSACHQRVAELTGNERWNEEGSRP